MSARTGTGPSSVDGQLLMTSSSSNGLAANLLARQTESNNSTINSEMSEKIDPSNDSRRDYHPKQDAQHLHVIPLEDATAFLTDFSWLVDDDQYGEVPEGVRQKAPGGNANASTTFQSSDAALIAQHIFAEDVESSIWPSDVRMAVESSSCIVFRDGHLDAPNRYSFPDSHLIATKLALLQYCCLVTHNQYGYVLPRGKRFVAGKSLCTNDVHHFLCQCVMKGSGDARDYFIPTSLCRLRFHV